MKGKGKDAAQTQKTRSSEPGTLQDDITVKPKGGGLGPQRLVWICDKHGTADDEGDNVVEAGEKGYLGDDIYKRLVMLKAKTSVSDKQFYPVNVVKFKVSDIDVVITKSGNGFRWTFSKNIPNECEHGKTCKNKGDGIPPEFMGELDGKIEALFPGGTEFVPVVELYLKGS